MINSLYDQFKRWSYGGSVYIISDTHFADPDCKIMLPEWPDWDEAVRKINSVVKKDDTLIVLGDVGDKSFMRFINAGRRILITGNHDKGASGYLRHKRQHTYDSKYRSRDEAFSIVHRNYPSYSIDIRTVHGTVDKDQVYYIVTADNGLFNEVYTGPLMIADRIMLSHEKISLPFVTNIHGHEHGGVMRYKNEFGCNCLNVASDVCGFTPINLGDEIKNGLLADTPSIHRLAIDKRI